MFVLISMPSDRLGSSLALALEAKVRKAGFRIARADEPHDIEAHLTVEVTETRGLFSVTVNGREKVGHVASVTLSVIGDGATIESARAEFDPAEKLDDDDIEPFVAAFTASDSVRAFAEARRTRRAREGANAILRARERAEAERREAEVEARRGGERDERTWLQAGTVACKVPGELTACDGVRNYLVKFPKGRHADEAFRLIDAAEPALLQLQRDENTWRGAGANSCRDRVGEDPCVGVELYVAKYSGGLHADEAKRLLKGAGQ